MLFTSEALAARIERAECRLLIEGTRAAARRRDRPEPFVGELGGGVATLGVPGSPLNKLAGLGFAGPLDVAELEAVERVFAAQQAPLQVELSNLADPSIGELLTRRGYELRGFENVLARRIASIPGAAVRGVAGVEVEVSTPDGIEPWIALVVTGFATPDAQGTQSHESFPRDVLMDALRDMAASDGFLRYLARRDGAPAGGASMRLCEGIAQLCGAATLPEHRRHGVQSALLARRLELAADEGCDFAVVTTQPGSKSQENVQRLGFELAYTRAVLVREP